MGDRQIVSLSVIPGEIIAALLANLGPARLPAPKLAR